ncbi:MAG: hypothetical protein DHS20C20_14170 [Ardenticatenaceae bacterium]|nr:MAG: hypothetical protein DHS20C20_14170 [Ardenticatenaceae bacterium]
MNNLAKFRQISWADRFLFFEATFWLALARLSLLLIPFRRLAPSLGKIGQESATAVASEVDNRADRIGWAVRAVARRTPWESACLAQAISAKAMLRRRQIPTTLYLGLAKDKSQQMQAHAWLRCGEAIITGRAGHEQYTIISTFADADSEEEVALSKQETTSTADIQELLLSVLNPSPQQSVVNQLKQLNEAEWGNLINGAKQQFIETLFLTRLEGLGVETAVPPHLLAQVKQKHQQITFQNMAMYRELNLVSQNLKAADIPVVLLKGAFLATAVYPHIGQRAMGDLDLLVSQENIPQLIDVLHTLGWQETRPFSLSVSFEQHHHLPPFAKKGTNFVIEPHWNIVLPERPYSIKTDQLWQNKMACSIAGSEAFAFQPHLQLLHLALHASYNHQFAFDLRSLCDIATVINHYEASLDWGKVVENAIAWNWQRGVYLTLALVKEFWETAVPHHVLAQLKPDEMPENMVSLAKGHLLHGRSENKKVSRNFAQLKSDDSIFQKVKFAIGFLFPTRRRLTWRYGVPSNSKKIWLYYFVNFRDMIRRNVKRSWLLFQGADEISEPAERRNHLSNWLGHPK